MGAKTPQPEHLGDGCYISFDGFQFILTANHHDPRLATDKIAVPFEAVEAIVSYKQRTIAFYEESK